MTQTSEQKHALKDTLKSLRAERSGIVETATQQNKQRMAARSKIRTARQRTGDRAGSGGSLRYYTAEVLWHVAAMRKYGELTEDAQEGITSPTGSCRGKAGVTSRWPCVSIPAC